MKKRPFKLLLIFCLSVFGLFFYLEKDDQMPASLKQDNIPLVSIKEVSHLKPSQKKVIKTFLLKKESIIKTMPLKRELNQAKDIHQTPEILVQKAKELAELKEMVIRFKDTPAIQREALDFYHECADHVDYPTSIRSLCLFNRLTIAKGLGESVDISEYPLEMKRLVLQLKPF